MKKVTKKREAEIANESTKYDWIPGSEGKALIYGSRKPSPIDPGVIRSKHGTNDDTLLDLLRKGRLEGQALQDAIELDIDINTK